MDEAGSTPLENWQKLAGWETSIKGVGGKDVTFTVINARALTHPLTELAT